MDDLTELQKDIICDKIDKLTNDMNDNELSYAIKIMTFWLEERKRQDAELRDLYGDE